MLLRGDVCGSSHHADNEDLAASKSNMKLSFLTKFKNIHHTALLCNQSGMRVLLTGSEHNAAGVMGQVMDLGEDRLRLKFVCR